MAQAGVERGALHRLDCEAKITERPGEGVFEQDRPFVKRDSGEFQALLNEVALRLQTPR